MVHVRYKIGLLFVSCIFGSLSAGSRMQGARSNEDQRLDSAIAREMNSSLPKQMPKINTRPLSKTRSPKKRLVGDFFKQRSFKDFLAQVYNDTRYADVLSRDPNHFEAMFKLAQDINLSAKGLRGLIRLYCNKMKSCEIIDPIVFERLSAVVPHYTKRFFTSTRKSSAALASLQSNVENTILSQLTNRFDDFENDPGSFIGNLSLRLTRLFDQVRDNDSCANSVEVMRLQQSIATLYETILSRVLWDMKSPEGVFDSFVKMGQGIITLEEKNILFDEQAKDLMWTLVHRFNYYLDLTGGSLPISFYEHTIDALKSGAIYFLEQSEEIKEVKTKKQTILDALDKSLIKAVAFEQGLITNEYTLAS